MIFYYCLYFLLLSFLSFHVFHLFTIDAINSNTLNGCVTTTNEAIADVYDPHFIYIHHYTSFLLIFLLHCLFGSATISPLPNEYCPLIIKSISLSLSKLRIIISLGLFWFRRCVRYRVLLCKYFSFLWTNQTFPHHQAHLSSYYL